MSITEKEMMVNIVETFLNLPPVEFVEEYNRTMGTNLIIDDVIWKAQQTNGKKIQYQIW